jgi:hypothetical protein
MQGLFIDGRRPVSKRAVKLALADPATAHRVTVEATSIFGNEYEGHVDTMPDGVVHFVGPDPYTKRNFYGTITKRDGKVTVK